MLYHSANDVFIGYLFVAYIILSLVYELVFLGYAVYKVYTRFRQGKRKKSHEGNT